MDQMYIAVVWPDGFWEKVEELASIAAEYCEQLAAAMRQIIAPAAENLQQALEEIMAGEIYTPRKPSPRPPRYAGPQNKGRSWTRQPPRVARSCCRKIRR